MSTDIIAAFDAVRARAEAQITSMPLFWQDEENELPDTPSAFAYLEMVTDRGDFIEIGGGRGSNLFRNQGELRIYVFVPRGQGLRVALAAAEPCAAAFRSYRGAGISCEGASVHPVGEGDALVPPGLSSAAGNYACAVVNVSLHFDQVG